MGHHCIICNFPCDEDVLFCHECVEADKTNERKNVNEEVRELHRLWGEDCERMNKEIDRNGKMATICGVPVPVVGGSWGEPRRKDHIMFKRR